jgi:hypothetical protein
MDGLSPEDRAKLAKEFSTKFLTTGLAGMFASDEYESVEIKITFNKKADKTPAPDAGKQ